MTYIPYSRQEINEDDIAAVTAVLHSDFLTQGPSGPAFEAAFAERHRAKFAISVANATAGLHIGCIALEIGPGSLVWTTPNSFVASANCALYVGAEIDFVDIDPATRNMSIEALEARLVVAESEGKLPNLLIPVDFAGLPSDLREMRALANRYGFRILQDASHATGATYLNGPVGSAYADITVFSFHAVKVITTGEGGMLTTNDPTLAHRLTLLRSHGVTRDKADLGRSNEGEWYYEQVGLGYNCRLTEIQSALGLSQLSRLEASQQRRLDLADRYDSLLAGLPLKLPSRGQDRQSAWHLYVVELTDDCQRSRADVFAGMRAAGIGVNVHYIPIHTQPHYKRLGFRKGDFPNAERYYDRAITLPLFPAMTHSEQDIVVGALERLMG